MALRTSKPSQIQNNNLVDYAPGQQSDDHGKDEDMGDASPPRKRPRIVVSGAKFDVDTFENWMASDQQTLQPVYSREEELQQRVLELETTLDIKRSEVDLKEASLFAQATGREIQMMRLEHQNEELKRFMERSVRRELETCSSVVNKACHGVVTMARELGKFSEPDMGRLIVQAQEVLADAAKGMGDSKGKIQNENQNSAVALYVNRKARVKSPKKKRPGRK